MTLRDGGYFNDHRWTTHEAESVVRAVGAAGVPYAEIGYLRGTHEPQRPTASCPPAYLDALANVAGRPALAVMVRPGEVPIDRIAELADRGVAMVRVLVMGGSVEAAEPYVAAARAAGLEVAMNLTRVSERDPEAIAVAVKACANAGAQITYLADSNGSLDPDSVSERIGAAVSASTVPVGFHAHDNLGLAFINATTAMAAGATALDASIAGIGKGGGNLRLEVIVAHLIVRHGARLRLDPIANDRTTLSTRLRMVADGGSKTVVTGLLDVNMDGAAHFSDMVAADGLDATILALTGRGQPFANSTNDSRGTDE
ncbi:MAG: pyruvate carboxyltransferase [Streptomycetaceae bacterium]|nr:pyruvate carboxyltransferase [Streptomycetaceae bacterium]